MKSDFSFGYRNTILWVIIALSVVTVSLGIAQYTYAQKLNNLLVGQQSDFQFGHSLNTLYLNMTTAESSQRGYIITGNQDYLKPYYSAIPLINRSIKILNNAALSEQYKTQIKNIDSLTSKKLEEMNGSIVAYQQQGQSAAIAIVNTDVGNNLMDSLRNQISSVNEKLSARIAPRLAESRHDASFATYFAPIAVLINLVLISEIILLARRAIVRQKLIEGYREQFVTVAAHQLRTPATAVKQYLYLLMDGFYGQLTKDQMAAVKLISDSNQRGIDVANSLLSVTKVDSGEISLKEETVNLNDILQEVIDHYAAAVKEAKNQTIVTKLNKRPVMAKVDPFYIKMVFENLIDNASKYSPEGKKIFVSLKPKDNFIDFTVRDQGIGVGRKDIPLLFRKFVRLDSAFKFNTEGSGLGLYLVKELVNMHGGKITVESDHDKGSTFTVRLNSESS